MYGAEEFIQSRRTSLNNSKEKGHKGRDCQKQHTMWNMEGILAW